MKASLIFFILLFVFEVTQVVRVGYRYEREIGSYWSLADKASTIEQKGEYVNKFVEALDASGAMTGHNAIIFKTPDNDLGQNMKALRSLQTRLNEIKTMDVQSFAYQQAIQQITAQEQGEAHKMLSMFYEGWLLHSGYWYLWEGFFPALISVAIMGALVSLVVTAFYKAKGGMK